MAKTAKNKKNEEKDTKIEEVLIGRQMGKLKDFDSHSQSIHAINYRMGMCNPVFHFLNEFRRHRVYLLIDFGFYFTLL